MGGSMARKESRATNGHPAELKKKKRPRCSSLLYCGISAYTQRDTPNPLGVYGKAKLEGEIRARNAYARSIVVRSGWIFGTGGTRDGATTGGAAAGGTS